MPHPFDLNCKHHHERQIDDRARSDRLCAECYIEAYNGGARKADAFWAENPAVHPGDEKSLDGRSIQAEHRGEYQNKVKIIERGAQK